MIGKFQMRTEPVEFRPYLDLPQGHLPFLMESQGKVGRFSFSGSDPYLVMYCRNGILKLITSSRTFTTKEDPFSVLREVLRDERSRSVMAPFPFTGGAVGYLGYGLGKITENVAMKQCELGLPDLYLAFYDKVLVADKLSKKSCRVKVKNKKPCHGEIHIPMREAPSKEFKRKQFLDAVKRAKIYIKEGDIYEVNLSKRFYVNSNIPPFDLYSRLRNQFPSPFGSYISLGGTTIISTSPEEFLFLKNDYVRTRPIKGTRRRGRDVEEDEGIIRELLTSKKDDAELAMIVDLERNDLGKVCQVGSVKVRHEKGIERHPTLFHTVATVEGRLRRGIDVIDLLKATFPGGSVTGAPKKRAMEIITQLEPVHRGPYTGAIGYIGFDGTMHMSMAIRIAMHMGNQYIFQTGGAIVHDSTAELEYDELLVKARAITDSLECS